jgi:transposase
VDRGKDLDVLRQPDDKKLDDKMINTCSECLAKQQPIDGLVEKIRSLESKLRYRKKQLEEGYFGSSTPSSKIPVKKDTSQDKPRKPKGAKNGHTGHGRKGVSPEEADQVVRIPAEEWCPDCGHVLESKGFVTRTVIESKPLRAEKIFCRVGRGYCPHCRKTYQGRVPGVLPRSLYGNQLIATAATMHYLHGIPMGRVCQQLGIGLGALLETLHRLSRLLGDVPEQLIEEYRRAPVKHADETGWRTEGKNGYA